MNTENDTGLSTLLRDLFRSLTRDHCHKSWTERHEWQRVDKSRPETGSRCRWCSAGKLHKSDKEG